MKQKNNLEAPQDYWELSGKQKAQYLNKCGPDGFVNKLIPNHLLGTDISFSCNIHDFTFIKAENQAEHRESDLLFLKNMKTQIGQAGGSWFIKKIRLSLALAYYCFVRVYSNFH